MPAVLSKEQIDEAIDQVVCHAQNLIAVDNYQAISVRGTLYTLGYETEQAEQVLSRLFEGGFSYCLDPKFHKGNPSYGVPSMDVCHFGPDQLVSRIRCVR
jgi:hypothetical protein